MSTVVLDTITGKSTATTITIGSTPVVSASANSMTIRGEGSAQTSIQQGLCKGWMNLTGTGTIAAKDSFNMSATTDHGTGAYTVSLGNDMNNNDWVVSGYAGVEGVTNGLIQLASTTGKTTALIRFNVWSGSEVQDSGEINIACHGDLA